MSDRQFEKNVQQKMDELRLHPSDTVWYKVEKKIHAQKRRRRGLIWIPLMAALLTGIFYYYSGIDTSRSENSQFSETENKSNSQKQTESANAPTPSSENKESPNNNQIKPDSRKADPQTRTAPTIPEKSIIIDDNRRLGTKSKSNANKTNLSVPGNKNKTGEYTVTKSGIPEDVVKTIEKNNLVENTSDKIINKSREENNVSEDQKNVKEDNNKKSTEGTGLISRNAVPDSVVKNDEVKQETPTVEKVTLPTNQLVSHSLPPIERVRRKWQIGISLHGGITKITTGSFLDFTEKSMVQDVAPSNFSMPVPRNAVIQKPSAIYPGFAMQLKGFVKTDIRKRFNASIGLGYGLYQTHIRVGQMIQSNQAVFTSRGVMEVQGYYLPEPNKVFTNRFHFIEMPLEFEYRLNKKRKIPLSLNAGLTYSRMLGSNALQFDGSSRVYYRDNTVYNKNLAGVTAGASVGILQNSSYPLTIGSSFHYRLTNLMHKNIYDRKHLLAAGLDVKMLLKKS